jgi:hypothetical protein
MVMGQKKRPCATLSRQAATALCNFLEAMEGVPPAAKLELACAIESRVGPDAWKGNWFFMMVDMFRVQKIQEWIATNSQRPMKGVLVWTRCMKSADMNDGEAKIDRGAWADELRIAPSDVSRALGELVKCNALIRIRDGNKYRYFVNPRVATNIAGEDERTAKQIAAPEVAGITGRFPGPQIRVVGGTAA